MLNYCLSFLIFPFSLILCLHYAAKRTGTVRHGKRDVCKQRFIAPYRSQGVRSEQQVWCCTLRYGTSKYSRVNIVGRMRLHVVRTRNYMYVVKNCTMTRTCVCQRTYRFTLALRRVTNYGPVDRRRNAEVNRDME